MHSDTYNFAQLSTARFFLNLKVKIEFLGSSCCLPLLRCRLKAGELSGVRNFRCIDLEMACFGDLKACPHCHRKVRLSPLSRSFLRQSHFSATVWTGLNAKVIPKWVLLKSAPVTPPLLLNEWWSEALSILSQKTATVAEFGDSLTFLRQYGQGLRQLSPKSRSAVEKTAEIDTNTNHSKGDSGNYHTGSFSPLCGHLHRRQRAIILQRMRDAPTATWNYCCPTTTQARRSGYGGQSLIPEVWHLERNRDHNRWSKFP